MQKIKLLLVYNQQFFMGRIQTEFLACPFCDKGKIECGYIPASFSIKQAKSRVIRGKSISKNREVWLVRSGCLICGKSQKEIEDKLEKDGII